MDEMGAGAAGLKPTDDAASSELVNHGQQPVKGDKSTSSTAHRSSSAVSLQYAVDGTLHFLSHASNETLGACLVGLAATTYFVFGRLGLVAIGVAGGVVLHATWEGVRHDDRDDAIKEAERERRRETAVELVQRVMALRTANSGSLDGQVSEVHSEQQLDFSDFGPESAKALEAFTDAVIKDYVYYWYQPTLPGEETFPATCKRTLKTFIMSISGHLQHKRPADVFLDFVTNASSIIVVFLNELAAATNASPNSSVDDAVATYLKLKPNCSLSYILNEKSQKDKLADVAEDILQAYLDAKSYNCPPVHTFLREVLAQLILQSTITLCSRPEWINEWIIYGLEESETTSKVMDIVGAGVEGRGTSQAVREGSQQPSTNQSLASRKEGLSSPSKQIDLDSKRQTSRAEEAMDEAMREAKRLTQLMIEEDERRARDEQDKQAAMTSSDSVSDLVPTLGEATPTSSQSERDRQDEELDEWGKRSMDASSSVATSDAKLPLVSSPTMTLLPPDNPIESGSERNAAQLTLHQAHISIFDDSQPGERALIKTKPTIDYLIQIEPINSGFSGWIIPRKYADFENLHEVLRRISIITGVTGFSQAHNVLPQWKGNTKNTLRTDLERYLTDAVKFQPLAESEGMKRFLDKNQGLNRSPSGKGFGWPTPDAFGKLGGDMVNALAKAPKQVAGGVAGSGKAVFGGVAGLVGSAKRMNQSQISINTGRETGSAAELNTGTSDNTTTNDMYRNSPVSARLSQDSLRIPTGRPALDRKISSETRDSADLKSVAMSENSSFDYPRQSVESMRESGPSSTSLNALSRAEEEAQLSNDEEVLNLPPPPSQMPEDYDASAKPVRSRANTVNSLALTAEQHPPPLPTRPTKVETRRAAPLTDRETSVAVELMFAVITELYTLSSAWNFRRTLLNAAKTFLLRPGNPQLAAIRDLLQTSLLDANLSDTGLSAHILKLRENALPTAEELEIWKRDFPEKSAEQKEQLRLKARKLLVTKGMPQALTSVMGATASGEALGKVFDCLQVETVSRGLVFGLMLQALKVVTH